MNPKTLVEKWVEAFNNRDIERLVSFYEDDAINNQVPEIEVKGKPAIRQMFADAFVTAEMVCMIENIFVDGDWAILEWWDPLGLRGCGFFQIRNGKIKFQRGYWDKLSFLKIHDLPIPQ
ncbi:MAG: nuclear transport factor 2 family protein [Anaerolineae bacterium]